MNTNRYNRGSNSRGPSKATPSTVCQKCLAKGHYSFECKTIAQERPYVSRPSRTQQLRDPKLVPKLTNSVPNNLLRKKGIADEQLAKCEQERGQKRSRQTEESISQDRPKRLRSASPSSTSVSSISTRSSRSPPPRRQSNFVRKTNHSKYSSRKKVTPVKSRSTPKDKLTNTLRSPVENKRRRESSSSVNSNISDDRKSVQRKASRRRYQSMSPPFRGRPIHITSPSARHKRKLSTDRRKPDSKNKDCDARLRENKPISRERSLSPFSKRLALTQALNSKK